MDVPNCTTVLHFLIALRGLRLAVAPEHGRPMGCFESYTADADLADLFRGLPDDRAQLPRRGYVNRGPDQAPPRSPHRGGWVP